MAPSGCYLRVEDLADPSGLYQLGDLIAEGTYGEIYLATEKSSGTKVAIKIVDSNEETFPDIEEEYRILKDLSVHQNIPKLHGIFRKTLENGIDQIWITMEYCAGGSVTDLVKRLKEQGQAMKEDHIAYILYHTVQAACHLHRNHVMHRDIKGQNILLTDTADVKLVDFGISRHLNSTMARLGTAIGTPYWMAPEVILCDQLPDREYDIRADVWSLGITAIELGDGLPPLADIHPVRAMFQITRNPPPTLARPIDWSQTFLDFIVECLEKNHESRPLMEELATHPFLTNVEPKLAIVQAELATLLASAGPPTSRQSAPQVTSKAGYLRTRPHSKSLEILQDDLAALEDVTEDAVLNLLKKRFHRDMIYTFVADILIAVNPYSDKALYDAKTHEAYCSRARSDNAPHVFAVADRAHQDMAHHQRPQTIIFTGETGAGKTFNARMALSHLCHLGKSLPLAEKVRGAGFVMELLGNAATSTNAASTRHVRFFETTFTKTGRLSGAVVWMCMLERWRLTDSRQNDGTFNALYAYFYGLQQSGRLGIYKLQSRDDYRFLPRHRYLDPIDSAEKFKEFERVLDLLEISKDKQETVRKVMAAIILLGEVGFEDGDDGSVSIVNKDVLSTVSFLLSVDETKLTWSLQHWCRITAGDTVKEVKTAAQAAASRDALARLLYGRLVDSIVNWVNAAFTLTRLLFGESNTVGLLDMYGFESRATNHLEQLLVNAFNEQLQSFFNQSVFQWEMEDFRGDDLDVPPYTFTDNSATIDMLMKKGEGLLALLDESTLSEKASDEYFLENCKESMASRHFIPEKGGFAIAHYAGKVSYSSKNIINKNKDHLDAEVFDTLRQSENPFLAPMFLLPLTKTGNLTMDREQAQRDAGGKGRRAKMSEVDAGNKRFDTQSRGRLSQTSLVLLTQASCYRFSAMEVMQKLINSTAHFVRCVRPNSDDAADTWDTGLVSHQLKCTQVINTIAIRKNGFSQRIDFAEFLRRYQFLAFDFDETVNVTRENCRLLMVRLKMDGYLMGREKIFIKYFNEEYMSRLYEHEVKKIAKVQAMIRSFLVRRRRRAGQPLDVTRLLASGDRQFLRRPSSGATGARYRRPSALSPVPENSLSRKMAAEKIQRYYKRWRGKTMFQQLQRYRAAKHHDLIIFSHQVHIYGQEFFQYLTRHKEPVPLESIAPVHRDSARNTIDARLKILSAVRKIPISRSLGDFVDTTAMCTPHQPTAVVQPSPSGRGSSSPDGVRRQSLSRHASPEREVRRQSLSRHASPEQEVRRQSLSRHASRERCPSCRAAGAAATIPVRASPSPAPVSPLSGHWSPDPGHWSPDPRRTSLEPISGNRSGATSPQFEFELPPCPVAPVSETRAVFDQQTARSRSPAPSLSAPAPSWYPGPAPSYPGPAPSSPAPAPAPVHPAPAAPSYNRFAGSSHVRSTAGGSMWEKRWATTASAPAPPFVHELQDKAGRSKENDDAPPFNFQGMLRKTNVTRNSMKRRDAGGSTGQASNTSANVVITTYGKPAGYNAKKMRNRSTDDQTGGPDRCVVTADSGATDAGGDRARRQNGAPRSDPAPSQNGSRAEHAEGSSSPQIVFEGEEVDL